MKVRFMRALTLAAVIAGVGIQAQAQPSMFDPTVTQVATGGDHSCALTASGGVKCWGQNAHGALGDGTSVSRNRPVDVPGLGSGVVSISAGIGHTCALTTSGGVKCWGWNLDGQLGDGTVTDRLAPVDVPGLTSGVAFIAAGGDHTCALTTAGGAKCWGQNSSGQLGDGTTTARLAPTDVLGLTSGVLSLSAGEAHTCALTLAGGLKCWGNNAAGQLGDGGGTNSTTAADVPTLTSGVKKVSAGASHTCALTTQGDVKCWGYNGYGQVGDGTAVYSRPTPVNVLGLAGAIADVSAGWTSTCVLTASGGMKCWGGNDYGILGDGTTTNQLSPTDVQGLTSGVASISVAATSAHACAASVTGGLKCWGYNGYGQVGDGTTVSPRTTPVSVFGLSTGTSSLSGGVAHTCGLTSGGTVKCWGQNVNGQVGDGTLVPRPAPVDVTGLSSPVKSLAAGTYHTCAVTAQGGVKCWGSNTYNQLGDGTAVDRSIPVDVVGLATGVVSVAAGALHTCALTTQGGVKCWGTNVFGGVGDGTMFDRPTPVDVQGLTSGVVRISSRNYHTCALTTTGGVMCWGGNDDGALGDGTTVARLAPVSVSGLSSGVAGISAGGLHTCALTTSGGAKCWGNNAHGRLGDGTTLRRLTPVDVTGLTSDVAIIEAGGSFTCATSTTGGAKCWGWNFAGGLGDGTTTSQSTPTDVLGLASGVASVAPGFVHACAVTVEGGVKCWGFNAHGELGDGTTTDRHTATDIRLGQSLQFTAPTSLIVGAPTPLVATATSGLAVAFDTWTPDNCSIDGTTVTATNPALCGIRASQSGDGTYAAAPQLLSLIVVPVGTVPDAPTIGVATAGDASAAVTFLPPANDGGSAITSYTAACGAASASGSASPIVVSGLENGVPVTCTVVATNWSGDSAPSAASNSVTPMQGADVSLTINLDGVDGGYGDVTAGASECNNAFGGPRTCAFSYPPGTVVHLAAHAAADSVFQGWMGACAYRGTEPNCDVTMVGNLTVGASYQGPQTLTIQVVSSENGVGQAYVSTNGGINLLCDGAPGTTVTCTAQVPVGDTVYFSAFPGNLSVLDSIAGCTADPLDPNGSGCYPGFVMTGPKAVAATFRGPQTLTVQAVSLENGVGGVYANSTGGMNLQCEGVAGSTATCTAQVRVGDTVYLSAFPGTLSVLDSIAGCTADPLDPNGSGCYPAFGMTGPVAVAATFRGPQTLTVQAVSLENGVGGVYANSTGGMNLQCEGAAGTTATCTAQVRVGDTVYFSAFPGTLSVLDSIAGCTADPLDPNGSGCYPGFVITGPKAVAATFRGPQTLTVQAVSVEGGVGLASANSSGGMTLQCEGAAGTTATCTAQVRIGDAVYFSAFPGNLSVLDSIAGCTADPLDPNGSGCYPGFVMTGPKAVAATFRGPQILTVGFSGAGSGGIDLPSTGVCASSQGLCAFSLKAGSAQQLVATPSANSLFQSWTGACAGQGATCSLTIMDDAVTQAVFGLRNREPIAVAGGPYSGVRNQAVSFAGGGSSDPDNDPLTYAWDFGDGSAMGTGEAPTHAYTTVGTFTVTLTVNDGTLNSVPATSTVTVSNQAPAANAGGPYSGVRGTAITFNGAGSNDADSDALTYAWDFGDSSPTGTGVAPTHAYAATGTFTVTLTVNDGTANSMPATTTVTISNQLPTANAGGPYTGVRNQAISFTGAASNDPDGDTLTYSWDFGDGSAAGTGEAPTHAYATTGAFTVTLTVNDGTTNSTPATSTVTISNQAPVANAGGPYSGVRNTAIAFSGSGSTDPDNDPLTYSWDFGDGSAAGTGAASTHAYAETGTFTVTLRVNDGATDSTASTSTVTIANQAPAANPGGPYSGTRLAAIAFNGAASSDPDGDALTYAWAFGDGSTGAGITPTHLYTAVGTFTVSLTVSDGTATSTPVTTVVQIANVTPTVSITTPAGGAVFHAPASVLIAAAAADSDGSVARVEFFAGAGKIGEAFGAPYSITWSGAAPGLYALTAVVTDGSGATATSAPVSVLLNAPPVVALTAPADNAQFTAPASITLTASASDSDGTIAQVEFFRGATSLGVDSTSPYSVTWAGAATGSYTLTAVATDNRGALVVSVPVSVKVTAILTPIADSYVRASNGNSNFGTATTVTVQQGSSNSSKRWTYMKFDLSSVPTITSARVRVFGAVSATTSTSIQTAVYSVSNTTWTETGLTWNNKPATGTTALGVATIVNNSTTARWYEVDVTAYLQAEKAAGRNVVALAFKNLANSSPYVSFTSKEGTAANRPQVLVVP